MNKTHLLILNILLLLVLKNTYAQNPIICNQFTADPSARVFDDSVYVYPSHDILAKEGRGHAGWFCMEDYHVFSSANLSNWIDHGTIVSQNKVEWADSTTFSMWAPDCIYKKGKYYFYFPAIKKDTLKGKGFGIGVTISDKPYGPFIPESEPILNIRGIDPNVFIDIDGQAYLFWALRNIYVAKLKDNMLELASEPKVIANLPEKGLKEGPFVFERNGIYYLTYPHVQNKIERLEYAISDNPMGPYKVVGVIMDESPMNCWTNQQSIIEFKGQWYLFYHQNEYAPKFDKNRSICIDSLFFNDDGTIRKVKPTNRGVALTEASQQIQIDRYSLKSDTGVVIAFLDSLNTFSGWKIVLNSRNAWIQYNAVDFGNKKFKSVQVNAKSENEGTVQIRLDKADGPIVSEIYISKSPSWTNIEADVTEIKPGIHNLILTLKNDNPVEIDWIRFIN
jgi:beta-xylosidase